MAPISFGGDAVTDVTIDGEPVSEITVDGEVVWTAGAIPTDGLIHRYPLDAGSGTTAVDSVGGVDGTITGASWITPADAHGGTALRFDGTDDYVDISGWGSGAVDTATGFSLSLRQYTESWPTSGEEQVAFIGDGPPQFELWCDNGTFVWAYWDGSTNHGLTGLTPPPTGQVNHLVGTFAGDGTFRLYYNATETASAASSASIGVSGTNNRLGAHPSVGRQYAGWLDDVLVYNRALSASEVADIYNVY